MNAQTEIHDVLDAYFVGLFNGDVAGLRSVFHPRAILAGEVKGAPYYKPLEEYLTAVQNRQSPYALGETFRMKVLSIDIVGNIAYAKTQCPMLGYNYVDLLSLERYEGRWVIVTKVFTHVE